MYKMVNITKEMYENNGIEVITDNHNTLWLNERHVQKQLGHKNLSAVTNKKRRYELIDELIKQSNRRLADDSVATTCIFSVLT